MNQKKIYAIDNGLLSYLSIGFSENKGQKLENFVYLELRRREKEFQEYSIFYHKEKYECDFLTKSHKNISQAYQVTTSLEDEKTKEREIRGLLEALEKYNLSQGYIITENEYDDITKDGKTIKIRPAWRWALSVQ